MFPKVLKAIIISLVVSALPLNSLAATANDILWNPGVSNNVFSSGAGLVPGAGIRNTGLLVKKSNPDELIMKIIMKESFEDRPFSGKGRNMAMWIYWSKDYCWIKESANCEGLFTIGDPINPSTYPSSKASEFVFVQKHEKASNVNVTASACKAPWWIESTFQSRDTWAFAVSITCLGIPRDFGWYAFSQIDIGQENIVSDFSSVQTITYPFHELANIAAVRNRETSTDKSKKQMCAVATTGKGYDEVVDFEEQCSDSNALWEFAYCDAHTKADLEFFQNKKWKKVRTITGTKGACEDPNLPNSFTFKSAFPGKYRVKNYGNSNFLTSYLNLKLYTKTVF